MFSLCLPLIPFYFMRHGETEWNKERRRIGQHDIPLNQTGISQAHRAADLLEEVPFDFIATSPLSRALQTAQIIQTKVKKPLKIMEGLKECQWGTKEGEIKTSHFWTDEWKKGMIFDGMEPYRLFRKRVLTAFHEILSAQKLVLIIAHSAVYWPLEEALHLPLRQLPKASPLLHTPPYTPSQAWHVVDLGENKPLT